MTEEKQPQQKYMGPHGLGDPDDESLRIIEQDVLIPKMLRERAQKTHCLDAVNEFNECAKVQRSMCVFKCRSENTKLWNCMEKWFYDEDFKAEMKKEYLEIRRDYRLTGVSKIPKINKRYNQYKEEIREELRDQIRKEEKAQAQL